MLSFKRDADNMALLNAMHKAHGRSCDEASDASGAGGARSRWRRWREWRAPPLTRFTVRKQISQCVYSLISSRRTATILSVHERNAPGTSPPLTCPIPSGGDGTRVDPRCRLGIKSDWGPWQTAVVEFMATLLLELLLRVEAEAVALAMKPVMRRSKRSLCGRSRWRRNESDWRGWRGCFHRPGGIVN